MVTCDLDLPLPHPSTHPHSLTFRESRPKSVARAPMCHCGKVAVLKSRVHCTSSEGGYSYYYTCDPSGSQKPCSFWKAADDLLLPGAYAGAHVRPGS